MNETGGMIPISGGILSRIFNTAELSKLTEFCSVAVKKPISSFSVEISLERSSPTIKYPVIRRNNNMFTGTGFPLIKGSSEINLYIFFTGLINYTVFRIFSLSSNSLISSSSNESALSIEGFISTPAFELASISELAAEIFSTSSSRFASNW